MANRLGEEKERVLESRLRKMTRAALGDLEDVVPGVDVVNVAQFMHLSEIGGSKFLSRQFTALELKQCGGNMQSLGARFAGKEATAKVLKTGFRGGLAARHIEILSSNSGAPKITLHGRAAERAVTMGFVHFEITLTHISDLAAAVVIGRKKAKEVSKK